LWDFFFSTTSKSLIQSSCFHCDLLNGLEFKKSKAVFSIRSSIFINF
jgi:hypothetical protein